MKVYSQIVCMWLVLLLISYCAPVATPADESATIEPQLTSTTGATEKYHSLDTRTGIKEIDIVLAAVESADPQNLRDLFDYSTLQCMTVNALGGPPPCREGEAEGTLVEVLPTLGPEGSYIYKDEIRNWPGLDVSHLYAIYQVSESAYSDENYPKGDYGVILIGKENSPNIVLQIKDGGIVRMDFLLDVSRSELIATFERQASDVIIAPLE